MSLYIHVGLPKAASSSIQRALLEATTKGDLKWSSLYVENVDDLGSRTIAKLLAQPESTSVVSGENLLGSAFNFFLPRKDRIACINLRFQGASPTCLLVLREMDAWFLSLAAEFVKQGNRLHPQLLFDSVCGDENFGYVRLVSDLVQYWQGNVTVIWCKEWESTVGTLLALLGLEIQPTVPVFNQSPPPCCLLEVSKQSNSHEFVLGMNTCEHSAAESIAARDWILHDLRRSWLQHLSSREREVLRQMSREIETLRFIEGPSGLQTAPPSGVDSARPKRAVAGTQRLTRFIWILARDWLTYPRTRVGFSRDMTLVFRSLVHRRADLEWD